MRFWQPVRLQHTWLLVYQTISEYLRPFTSGSIQAMFKVYSLSQLPDEICKRIMAFVVKYHSQKAAILVKGLYCTDCQSQRPPLLGWKTYAVREGDLSNCVMQQGPMLRSFPCASFSPLLFIRMMYRLCKSVTRPGQILIRLKDSPYRKMSFRAQAGLLYIIYCKNGVDHKYQLNQPQ